MSSVNKKKSKSSQPVTQSPTNYSFGEKSQVENKSKKSNKKKLIFAVIALVIVLGIGIAISNRADEKPVVNTKPGKDNQEVKNNVRVYDSSKYVFGMPESWRPLNQDELENLNASGGIKSNDNKAIATMTVVDEPTSQGELLNKVQQRQRQLAGYQKISDTKVKVGNLDGVTLTYTFKGKDSTTQQTIYAVSSKADTYYLALTAAQEGYSGYEADWSHIIASFRIK